MESENKYAATSFSVSFGRKTRINPLSSALGQFSEDNRRPVGKNFRRSPDPFSSEKGDDKCSQGVLRKRCCSTSTCGHITGSAFSVA
jgi:hypothetical protein